MDFFVHNAVSFAKTFPLFFVLLIFFIVLSVILFFSLIKKKSSLRKDAVKRSRAVIGGQVAEQFAPFLPDFPGTPSNSHFIGKPVDFISFEGLSETGETNEILFIEVKTGKSELSAREKSVKKAVEEGRVRYAVYRADKNL